MLEVALLCLGAALRAIGRIVDILRLVVFHALVCVRNARKLLALLISGTKAWVVMFGRLIAFTVVLGPGWYQLLRYWFFDPFILRNVEFGLGAQYRNVMDIYLPTLPCTSGSGEKVTHASAPVVVFVSGGAWMIGYKLWSALVGRGLAAMGMIVVVPDYRNFPQGDIEDMMSDIRRAVLWTAHNISRFGGDPNKICLAGQSAGAHICMCLLTKDYLATKQKERHGIVLSEQEMLDSSLLVLEVASETASETARADSEQDDEDDDLFPHCDLRHVAAEVSSPRRPDDLEGWFAPLSPDSAAAAATPAQTSQARPPGPKPLAHDPSIMLRAREAVLRAAMKSEQEGLAPIYPNPPVETGAGLGAEVASEEEASILPLVRLFVGVSGPYNLLSLQAHLHERGLDASILSWICRGDLAQYSPTAQLAALAARVQAIPSPVIGTAQSSNEISCFHAEEVEVADFSRARVEHCHREGEVTLQESAGNAASCLRDFPPVALFHGSLDHSIPTSICCDLAQVLQQHGAHAVYSIYEGWSHTDAILEAPLLGNTRLFRDVVAAVHFFTDEDRVRKLAQEPHLGTSPRKRVVPTDYSPLLPAYLHRRCSALFSDVRPRHHHSHSHSHSHSHAVFEGGERQDEKEPALAPRLLVKTARFINPF